MGSRTYLPQLRNVLRSICIYITRYESTIRENLSDNGKAALDALLIACSAMLIILDDEIPDGV